MERQRPLDIKLWVMEKTKRDGIEHIYNCGGCTEQEYEDALKRLDKDMKETREYYEKLEKVGKLK